MDSSREKTALFFALIGALLINLLFCFIFLLLEHRSLFQAFLPKTSPKRAKPSVPVLYLPHTGITPKAPTPSPQKPPQPIQPPITPSGIPLSHLLMPSVQPLLPTTPAAMPQGQPSMAPILLPGAQAQPSTPQVLSPDTQTQESSEKEKQKDQKKEKPKPPTKTKKKEPIKKERKPGAPKKSPAQKPVISQKPRPVSALQEKVVSQNILEKTLPEKTPMMVKTTIKSAQEKIQKIEKPTEESEVKKGKDIDQEAFEDQEKQLPPSQPKTLKEQIISFKVGKEPSSAKSIQTNLQPSGQRPLTFADLVKDFSQQIHKTQERGKSYNPLHDPSVPYHPSLYIRNQQGEYVLRLLKALNNALVDFHYNISQEIMDEILRIGIHNFIVYLTINRQGMLTGLRITPPLPVRELHELTFSTIKDTQPFPALPEHARDSWEFATPLSFSTIKEAIPQK